MDDALDKIEGWRRTHTARSIALEANAADVLPEIVQRRMVPDILTDQTSAHDALNGYIPRTYNWGVSLIRPKFSVHVNWNYRGKQRRTLVTGRGIAPETYQWGSERLYVDLTGDYHLTPRLSLFASVRNLTKEVQDLETYNISTPESARFLSRGDYAGTWSFGVKGSF